MKAKRVARCLPLKKTGLGTTGADVCGAGNATAKGLLPCHSFMIQVVKIHIVVIALVR